MTVTKTENNMKLPLVRNNLLRMTGILARYGGWYHLEDFFYDGRDQENWYGALHTEDYFALLEQRKLKSAGLTRHLIHYRERDRKERLSKC